jgi:TonB family protein
MTRSCGFALVFSCSVLAACGGSAPEPETPATETPPVAAASDAPAAPAAKSGGDGWEGESEAKSDAAPAAEAKPAPGNPDIVETRTLEVIQKLVKDNRKPVRECYEKARKDLPSLQGDMIIHFVLDPEGKVKKIEVDQARSSLKSPVVSDCAIKTIKGISFPPSSRGMETTVNYPYNFTP